MNNTKAFGSVLSRIRKEQGYASAHHFFKSIGGSKSLGLAFVSYWDMERGKKLPKSWRLKTIMTALGIEDNSLKAQELVRAYFKALSGSDELVHTLSGPAPAGADLPSRDLIEAATDQALTRRSVALTIEQWKLCARDMVTNVCIYFLANTAGWVTVRELSDATRFKPEKIRKALKTLASGGLVDFSGDRARSPFAEKVAKAMPIIPETAAVKAALRDHWKTWLAGSKLLAVKSITVRMTKSNMEIYRQLLEKAVNMSTVYDNVEADRRDSAIYAIDASIFQILPRD